MLIQYKVKNAIFDIDNDRIEAEMSIIMRDAHTTLGVDKRDEMLKKFEEDGLITMPNGGKQAKYIYLQFVDKEMLDEIAIIVEDFEDFYLYFEQYVKGGRLIKCSECGKLVLDANTGAGKPIQYCKKCIREREVLYDKRYNEKRK